MHLYIDTRGSVGEVRGGFGNIGGIKSIQFISSSPNLTMLGGWGQPNMEVQLKRAKESTKKTGLQAKNPILLLRACLPTQKCVIP